jgi:hypothetical protein
MNPAKEIGRYQIPILSVIGIKRRTGLAGWWRPGYDVWLANGRKIHFTEEEKGLLDAALDEHDLVMQIYGMCQSAGLRA